MRRLGEKREERLDSSGFCSSGREQRRVSVGSPAPRATGMSTRNAVPVPAGRSATAIDRRPGAPVVPGI
jgi:hypothetical protein